MLEDNLFNTLTNIAKERLGKTQIQLILIMLILKEYIENEMLKHLLVLSKVIRKPAIYNATALNVLIYLLWEIIGYIGVPSSKY